MLADRIRALRISAGMTQKELARRLGVSPSTVGMYEQGRRMPDVGILLNMCAIFGTTTDWLLSGEDFWEGGSADMAKFVESIRHKLISRHDDIYYLTSDGTRRPMTDGDVVNLYSALIAVIERHRDEKR